MKGYRGIGNILLLITAVIWGTAFVFQRVGMDSIEPVTFTSARMWLAAGAAGAVSALQTKRRQPEEGDRTEQKKRQRNTVAGGILCGCFLAAASVFQQAGIVTTTAGKAGFITALYILLVPLFSTLLWKKHNAPHVWAAIAMGVAGLYLLCISESFQLTRGDTLVFICAVFFSGHILCCDYFAKRADPVLLSAVQFMTVAVITGVIALICEEPGLTKLKAAAVPILYCGIMSGGVGYTLQIVAQRVTEPTVASMILSLESVFAAAAGALLLHERMSSREILGCVIMFAAITLVQIPAEKIIRKARRNVS